MADFKINEGQCFVFVNEPSGNKPCLKGSFMVDGKEYEIACWPAKSGKKGSYSGKIQPKKSTQPGQEQAPERRESPVDSEIPF